MLGNPSQSNMKGEIITLYDIHKTRLTCVLNFFYEVEISCHVLCDLLDIHHLPVYLTYIVYHDGGFIHLNYQPFGLAIAKCENKVLQITTFHYSGT